MIKNHTLQYSKKLCKLTGLFGSNVIPDKGHVALGELNRGTHTHVQ